MLRNALITALALLALVPFSAAAAQQKQPTNDKTIELLLQSMVISIEIPLPSWNDGPNEWGGKAPKLTFIRRTEQPDLSGINAKFFGKQENLSTESIKSPAYGGGTRYKGPRLEKGRHAGEKVGYTFYLDKYKWGFEYVNNLAEIPTNTETSDSTAENRKYNYKYSKQDGVAAAKKFINDLTPGIGEPGASFAIKEDAWFDTTKGRLFIYRLTKSFHGVPLADDYIQVALDGEKNVANVSYFWCKAVEGYGDTYTAIDAGRAIQYAKIIALDDFANQPPPLTLFNAKLGYVNYRKDPSILLPAWLFDCRWNETRKYENPNWNPKKGGERYGTEIVVHNYMVGVDAFFGTKVELTK
jgi:hypothetical protein